MAGLFDSGGAESSVQHLKIRPEDEANLSGALYNVNNSRNSANLAADSAASQLKTDFGSFAPSQGLDAISQGLVSQGRAALAGQQASRGAQISQATRGNAGLGRVLGFQNAFQSAAAGNSLPFAAHSQQFGRELSTNQQNANLQTQGNSALGQKAQLGQQPFSNSILSGGFAGALAALRGQKQALTLNDLVKHGYAGVAPAGTFRPSGR